MKKLLERRLAPAESTSAVMLTSFCGIFAAFVIAGLLFIPFGGNPLAAYGFLFDEAFGSLRSIGLSTVQATPLILIALATIVVWRAGLGYIGFEGCFLVGATAASWIALAGTPQGFPWSIPHCSTGHWCCSPPFWPAQSGPAGWAPCAYALAEMMY